MNKLYFSIVVIICISLFCTVALADNFSDVKSTKFSESVDVLSTLSIINGYEDGTYRPNNPVTRAEMAKLIIVTLGKDSVATSLKGNTQFSDVVSGGWASGYINCAVAQNIIKGYPDGTFKPNNSVSYAEAATMLLRALNYTKELETKEYPKGYMEVAKDAGILEHVQASSSSDKATRGYIANMILDTLKTGVRKIVATNTNGSVTYGAGTPLIEQSFSKMKCVKDGEVLDVDFDEMEITVRDKANNRKLSLDVEDEDELATLYLRKVDFIYDSNKDEFLSFDIVDNYTIKDVEIEEIRKGTIYGKDDKEYDLPDSDDVIMPYISNYDEAEVAHITYDGDKMLCVLLEGTPKIYVGLVSDASLTVSKRAGIEVYTTEDEFEEYPLSNINQKVKFGEVILYALDNDEYIIVKERIAEEDAGIVETLDLKASTPYIKIKQDKNKYELSSTTEYYVYQAKTNDTIKKISLKDIDEEFDLVYVTKFADVYYIIDFEDSVDDDDIVSKLSVSEAKDKLEETLDTAKRYYKKESSYSVETYELLREAYEDAQEAYKGTSSAARLELAERKLSQAVDGLKSATSEDKELRSAYSSLQSAIKEAEGKKSADYTQASFATLTTELKNAKAVSIANTTVSKIETRTNALNKAINMLVTVAANNEIQSAISNLKNLISRAEALVKNKNDYTDDSFNAMNTALTNAKKLNTSTASISEIKNQANNLEATIDALVPKTLGNYTSARSNLDNNYNSMNGINNSDGAYTEASFGSFSEAREGIKSEYSALPSSNDVQSMSASDVTKETEKVNNLNTKIENAKKLLVSSKLEARLNSLKTLIEKGKAIKQEDWTDTHTTFAQFQTMLSNAEKVANDNSKTIDEIQAQIDILIDFVL